MAVTTPTVGGSRNQWGTILNTGLDDVSGSVYPLSDPAYGATPNDATADTIDAFNAANANGGGTIVGTQAQEGWTVAVHYAAGRASEHDGGLVGRNHPRGADRAGPDRRGARVRHPHHHEPVQGGGQQHPLRAGLLAYGGAGLPQAGGDIPGGWLMIGRAVLRAVSHLPGIPSDVADWYDEMREISAQAGRQRVEDEGADSRDKRDPSRWVQEPDRRRAAPKGRRHDAQ